MTKFDLFMTKAQHDARCRGMGMGSEYVEEPRHDDYMDCMHAEMYLGDTIKEVERLRDALENIRRGEYKTKCIHCWGPTKCVHMSRISPERLQPTIEYINSVLENE